MKSSNLSKSEAVIVLDAMTVSWLVQKAVQAGAEAIELRASYNEASVENSELPIYQSDSMLVYLKEEVEDAKE